MDAVKETIAEVSSISPSLWGNHQHSSTLSWYTSLSVCLSVLSSTLSIVLFSRCSITLISLLTTQCLPSICLSVCLYLNVTPLYIHADSNVIDCSRKQGDPGTCSPGKFVNFEPQNGWKCIRNFENVTFLWAFRLPEWVRSYRGMDWVAQKWGCSSSPSLSPCAAPEGPFWRERVTWSLSLHRFVTFGTTAEVDRDSKIAKHYKCSWYVSTTLVNIDKLVLLSRSESGIVFFAYNTRSSVSFSTSILYRSLTEFKNNKNNSRSPAYRDWSVRNWSVNGFNNGVDFGLSQVHKVHSPKLLKRNV